jgi:excisionase family DNA binding protein
MVRRKLQNDGPVYYSTHQVAGILGVSLPTVVNWVNTGKLPAHRTPGGHRRMTREDVIAFARTYDYPLAPSFVERGGPTRVLIVDDERDFSDLLRDYLVLKSIDVEVADSGFQAGLMVARFKPHLIVMDLMMPDMDGFQAHRMLRAHDETAHIPVIACTGYLAPDIVERLRSEGFRDWVEKPVKLDQVLDLVHRHAAP